MFLKQSIQRLIATAVLSAATVVLAQSGGGYDLTWSTIDGGGAMFSSGGGFELGGTIGQPHAQVAPVMIGGTFELTGGFWPVANVCYCLGDLNADGKRDGRDIQQFLNCVLAGGNCSCADVDQAGGVNLNDVSAFVSDLLTGATCP